PPGGTTAPRRPPRRRPVRCCRWSGSARRRAAPAVRTGGRRSPLTRLARCCVWPPSVRIPAAWWRSRAPPFPESFVETHKQPRSYPSGRAERHSTRAEVVGAVGDRTDRGELLKLG